MLHRERLSFALASLPAPGAREAMAWAAGAGFRAVQIDVAAPGLRPRELERSARRDLAALLRRLELACSGLDLWVPPAHFGDPARVERACEAVEQACAMADELARLSDCARVVAVMLPAAPLAGVRERLDAAALRHGAALADHAHPPTAAPGLESLRVGVDPAAVLAGGGDPLTAVAGAGARLAAARLSDLTGAGRVCPGLPGGRLDASAYLAALDMSPQVRHVTLDLRQVPDSARAATDALARLVRD